MSALSPIEKHTLWEDFSVRGPVRAFVLFLLCELSWPDVRKTVALADSTVYECFGVGGRLDFSHESHRSAVIPSNPVSTTCTLEHDTMETWYWRVLITARSEVRISYRRNKKSRLVRRALRILLRYETLQLRLIGVITLPTFLPSPLIFLARAILYLTREGQQSSQMLQSKHTPLPPSPSWGGGGGGGESEQRVEVGGETRGEKGRGSPVWAFVMGRLYSAVSYRESRGEREGGLRLQEQQTHQKNSGATMWMGPKAEVSFIFLHVQP